MSTVAEIEAVLPTLSSEELRRVKAVLHRVQNSHLPENSWMELAGCLSGEADELNRIERVVKAEFEHVDPTHWQ